MKNDAAEYAAEAARVMELEHSLVIEKQRAKVADERIRKLEAEARLALQNVRTPLRGDQARIEFIRRAVMIVFQQSALNGRFVEYWEVARKLWDAKPADC